MRSERWYQIRLSKYFTDKYGQYEETAEFYPDPSKSQWLFDIPELSVRIKLTCYDDGEITEFRYRKGRARV